MNTSRIRTPFLVSALVLALAGVTLLAPSPARSLDAALPQNPAADNRENACRANNIGVALLEQFKHKESSEQFKRALQLDPRLAIARVNLAIAFLYLPDLPASLQEARTAATLLPASPQPPYILGLIAKAQNRPEDATAFFQQVLKIDSKDVGASVNLGQLYLQQRKYAEAVPT